MKKADNNFIFKYDEMKAIELQNNYNKIKVKYPDAILLFRVGNNFIALRDDANIVAKVCGIQETNTIVKFSYNKLDDYLPKLVRSGHRTAVCEELQLPKKTPHQISNEWQKFEIKYGVPRFSQLLDNNLALLGKFVIDIIKFDDWLHKQFGDYESEDKSMSGILLEKYGYDIQQYVKQMIETL